MRKIVALVVFISVLFVCKLQAADVPVIEFEEILDYDSFARFSPDNKKIVTRSNRFKDYAIQIWDAESGKKLNRGEGHTDIIWDAEFSPDGKKVVTASWDNTARIWDAESGKELHKLEGHTDSLCSAVFSPDGKKVVSASDDDKTVRIWDAESGKELHKFEVVGGGLRAIFSPDGKKILTVSLNHAKIWDAESGRELFNLERQWWTPLLEMLIGESELRKIHRLVWWADFSPDGRKIVTVSSFPDEFLSSSLHYDYSVEVWDANSGEILKKFDAPPDISPYHSACFSQDGKKLFVADISCRNIQIWDADSGKELKKIENDDPVHSRHVGFSLDRKRFFTLDADTIQIWDADLGKELKKWKYSKTPFFPSASFSPDGKKIVLIFKDIDEFYGTAKILDLEKDERIAKEKRIAEEARIAEEQRIAARIAEEKRIAERKTKIANATDIKSEILKNGLIQLSDYSQYGSAAVRNLAQGDAFDKAAAQPKIQAAQAEITQKTFVGQYGYSTSDVKVVANASSFTMTIPTGFAFTTIDEIVFPVPGVTGTKGNADASQIILSVSGNTDGIRELVRNGDNYQAKVWFTNLRTRGNSIVADVLKIEIVKVK